ncbi:hypothetical protein M4I21_07745 [Cellulophaga sp. 20_2_10]|uniref:hypothetical protein n=1 Tax=Cellulophaga sp. 20_2_10 TaxID=2942476 RepID=UPI00201B3218|nr:hypothetical protein [Cellulophaga sp. 20_2_10]MCL5245695.1 hypothetical protein [Cellulophaga sp. 20_2_10]
MKGFSKLASSIFHPLFTPVIGTLCYFKITPQYYTANLFMGNLLPILILTVIVPLVCYIILRSIGALSSFSAPSLEERKYPLYISLGLLLLIVYKVIPNNYSKELFFFFLGLVAATFSTLVLLFMRFKSSMHLMGLGTLTMLLINLSVHFEVNIIFAIATAIICTGIVATSRLYLKANNSAEIIVGFLIGLVSQLITIKYWL